MNVGETNPIVLENDTVTYYALPIQVLQSGHNNSYVVEHNVVLKSLPDGNFLVDTDQFNKNNNFVTIQTDEANEALPIQPEPQTVIKQDKPKPKVRFHNKSSETLLYKHSRPKKDNPPPPDRIGPFKCDKCSKEFQKWVLFKRHEKTHVFEKRYKCKSCSASYNILSNFLLHEATHNTANPTCPECGKKFQRIASLKAHLMHHEKEEMFYCQECDLNFTTEIELNDHVKDHGKDKRSASDLFQCKYCQHNFTSHSEYKKHMTEHSKMRSILHTSGRKRNRKVIGSDRKFSCPQCNKKFQKHSQIERHLRVHSGEKPFKCTECPRAFSQKGSLKIHMSKHDGHKPHKCALCPAQFSQKGNLRAHILKTHSVPRPGENVYSCSECSCVFKKIGSLNGHMTRNHPDQKSGDLKTLMSQLAIMHSKMNVDSDILQEAIIKSDLPEVENECLEKLPNMSTTNIVTLADLGLDGMVRRYVIKQRRVGDVRWHQCPYCSKEFKKPSDLVRHLRVHTREKPFKCKLCYRSFAVKSTLTAHVRTHTGVKEYKCNVCSKCYMTPGSLNMHLKTHTVPKSHICTICNKQLRTNTLLKKHLQTHSANKDNLLGNEVEEEVVMQDPIIITSRGIQMASMPKKKRPLQEAGAKNRPYICVTCNACFRKLSHLKQHHVMHTGERPYGCPICLRNFTSSGVLKSHILTHNGTKPYKCTICSKNFTTNGSLRRHVESHNTTRPVLCPYCYKTFKTVVNCRKHMKIHKSQVQQGVKDFEFAENEQIEIPPDLANALTEDPFTLEHTINADDIIANSPLIEEPNQEITHTIQADETGTVVLPVISSQENFTEENIQEIEDTLNNQMLNIIGSENFVDTTAYTDKINEDVIPSTDELVNTLTGESVDPKIMDDNQLLYETVFVNLPPGSEQIPNFDQAGMDNFILSQLKFQNDPLFMSDLSTININEANNALLPFQMASQAESQHNQMIMMEQDLQQADTSLDAQLDATQEFLNQAENVQDASMILSNDQHFLDAQGDLLGGKGKSLNDIRPSIITLVNSYQCDVCKMEFKNKKYLDAHQCMSIVNVKINPMKINPDTYDNDTAYIINKIDQSDADLDNADTEQNQDEKSKAKNQCMYCVKSFRKPSDLIRHIRTHTGERPFKCKECAKCFSLKSTLESHSKIHQERKDFVCQVCSSLFATKGSLKVHMRLHTGARPFKCPVCPQKFRTTGHRNSHVEVHYKESLKTGKISTDRVSRKTRMAKLIDTTLENLAAMDDDKPINDSQTIKEHLVLSSLQIDDSVMEQLKNNQLCSEDVIIESENGQIFEIESDQNQIIYIQQADANLLQNQNEEANNRKQQITKFFQDLKNNRSEKAARSKPKKICEFCGKEFSMKYLLDRHLKTHTNERTFKCTQCKQTFNQKTALTAHMRIHVNSRPYACPHCSNAFCQSGNLKTHIKRIHGIQCELKPENQTSLLRNQITIPIEFDASNLIIQTDSFSR